MAVVFFKIWGVGSEVFRVWMGVIKSYTPV